MMVFECSSVFLYHQSWGHFFCASFPWDVTVGCWTNPLTALWYVQLLSWTRSSGIAEGLLVAASSVSPRPLCCLHFSTARCRWEALPSPLLPPIGSAPRDGFGDFLLLARVVPAPGDGPYWSCDCAGCHKCCPMSLCLTL